MLSVLAPRFMNLGLRATAMGSRFVLVIVLARLLEPAEVGLFGLFLATVTLSVLILGGEFYAYSQRELMSLPVSRWSFVVQHQMIAIGLLYFLLLPPQLLIFWFDLLPESLLYWFIVLLVVEHIGQEINRLLVAMQHPIVASWILFIRMGAWVIYIVPLMWVYPETRELDEVFKAWFVGALVAVLIGGTVIYREIKPWGSIVFDWAWIKRGFKISLLFVLATISFKTLTTADRYIVEYLNNPDYLGVYVLFIGMAMAVVNFLDPAVFSFLYPRAVAAYRQGDILTYKKVMKEMVMSSFVVTILLVAMIALIAPLVLEWIGRDAYQEHISLLWVLLVVSAVYAVGMIPHYGLYAKGADNCLVLAHISSLGVFAITVVLLASKNPLLVTAYGLLSAFVWMGVVKSICYFKLSRSETAGNNYLSEDESTVNL